jgi:23S rRNA (cytidine1920-2'-O)/16S rRNA (cytidine1409-2'-O)-methyltransferase
MARTAKERLDKLLVDRGLCQSRAQAQALIMDGKVKVAGSVINKPGTLVATEETAFEISGLQPYVSRGGLKLEKALSVFGITPQDRNCIDVGASTGGFTDCLLQNGAAHVTSVDVGYGQLDWKLRQDERVQVLEKTNIRNLSPEQLSFPPSLGVVDTSFISLKKVLPPLATLLQPEAEMITLLKPQFEHRDYIDSAGFKGVVRGMVQHEMILAGVTRNLFALLPDWQLVGLDFSPITGPKGNIEFLMYWVRGSTLDHSSLLSDSSEALSAKIRETITNSYADHGEK